MATIYYYDKKELYRFDDHLQWCMYDSGRECSLHCPAFAIDEENKRIIFSCMEDRTITDVKIIRDKKIDITTGNISLNSSGAAIKHST